MPSSILSSRSTKPASLYPQRTQLSDNAFLCFHSLAHSDRTHAQPCTITVTHRSCASHRGLPVSTIVKLRSSEAHIPLCSTLTSPANLVRASGFLISESSTPKPHSSSARAHRHIQVKPRRYFISHRFVSTCKHQAFGLVLRFCRLVCCTLAGSHHRQPCPCAKTRITSSRFPWRPCQWFPFSLRPCSRTEAFLLLLSPPHQHGDSAITIPSLSSPVFFAWHVALSRFIHTLPIATVSPIGRVRSR